MRTLMQKLDPRTFDPGAYLREFEAPEDLRFSFKNRGKDPVGRQTAAIVALHLAAGFRGTSFSGRASNESTIEITPWSAQE